MRILILGAGKMGSFFTDVLSFDHDCAVYEVDPHRMRFLYHTQRFTSMEEIEEFQPELVINAVTLKYTLQVFNQVIPHLPKDCIISDISSVKTDFLKFYESTGMRYVSTHPMFGPTFANLGALSSENAIVIKEESAPGYLASNPDFRLITFSEGNGFTLPAKGSCVGLRKSDTELLAQINEILATIDSDARTEMWNTAVANQPK